jgi:type II secretory pathway pseudopilin PulG
MRKQRGISLVKTIVVLAVLGFVGVMAAKLLPAYLEYYSVKKIFATMEQAGALKGTVREIRYQFDKLNAIENITSVKSEDLEVSKEGGETILSATWSVKIPLQGNVNACLDFFVTTAK